MRGSEGRTAIRDTCLLSPALLPSGNEAASPIKYGELPVAPFLDQGLWDAAPLPAVSLTFPCLRTGPCSWGPGTHPPILSSPTDDSWLNLSPVVWPSLEPPERRERHTEAEAAAAAPAITPFSRSAVSGASLQWVFTDLTPPFPPASSSSSSAPSRSPAAFFTVFPVFLVPACPQPPPACPPLLSPGRCRHFPLAFASSSSSSSSALPPAPPAPPARLLRAHSAEMRVLACLLVSRAHGLQGAQSLLALLLNHPLQSIQGSCVLIGPPSAERLRLAGGPHGCAGRLEVRHGGRWGTVCDDGWDLRDAAVACRELGCGGALAAPAGAFFGEGTGPVWLSELACRGSESRLGLCHHRGWKAHICSHEEDAGLVCVGQRATNSRPDSTEPLDPELGSEASPTSPAPPLAGNPTSSPQKAHRPPKLPKSTRAPLLTSSASRQERLRLTGGPHSCSGRLEVWHGGQWGTVCDDGWDLRDAAVACRELGCGGALAAPGGARFGEGSGPVWMDDVGCGGGEQALQDCPRSPWGRSNCDHTEDAGLVCEGPAPRLRLAGGPNGCAGRLEVWHGGRWGTVCDDGWDLRDAAVACRELGCGGALAAPGGAFFGEGAGPILLDDLRCKGNETSLGFCPARPWGQHDCHHREDAGAVCDGLPLGLPTPNLGSSSSNGTLETQSPTSGPSPASPTTLLDPGPEDGTPHLRLVSGPGRCAGRLEVWYGGHWGTVCDDSWDVRDAAVVCRELGCGIPREPGPAAGRFGWGEGPIWLDDVACTGAEAQLANCPAAPWGKHNCAHNEDVGVTCTGSLGSDSVPDPFSWSWAPEPHGDGQGWPVRKWTTENPEAMATQLTTRSPTTTVAKPGRTPHGPKKWAVKKPRKPTGRPPGQTPTKVPRRQATRLPHSQATPQLTTQAPRGQTPQASSKLTTQAPQGQNPRASSKLTTQAPRGQAPSASSKMTTQGPRGQTSQAPPKLSTQAPRGQPPLTSSKITTQGPRGQTSQASPNLVTQAVHAQTSQNSPLLTTQTSLPNIPLPSLSSPQLTTQSSQRQSSQVPPELSTQVPKEVTPTETSQDAGSSTPGAESSQGPPSTVKATSSPQAWPGSGEAGLFRLRLSDGPDRCAGRLEVRRGGLWGTVCDDGWDPRDAAVACRELGCGGIRPRVGKTYYGSGTGPIWLDDVGCVGIEASLADCPASRWGSHNCDHQEDVGLTCTGDMEDDSDFPWAWDTSSSGDRTQGSLTTGVPGATTAPNQTLAPQTPWDHRDADFHSGSQPVPHTATPKETSLPDLQMTTLPSAELTTELNTQLTSDLRLALTTDPSPHLTPDPYQQPTPDPSPQLTTDPGQLLTLDPKPQLISDISQKQTSDVVLELASDPSPQPTPDSTPQLTSDRSPVSMVMLNPDLQLITDSGPQLTPSSTPQPMTVIAPQWTSDTNQQLTIETPSQLTFDPSPQLTTKSALDPTSDPSPQLTPDSISSVTTDPSLQMPSNSISTPELTTKPPVNSQVTPTSSPAQTKQLMPEASPSPKVTTTSPRAPGLTQDLPFSIELSPELSSTSQQTAVPSANPGMPSEYIPSTQPPSGPQAELPSSSWPPPALGKSPTGPSPTSSETARDISPTPSPTSEPPETTSLSPDPPKVPDSLSRQSGAQEPSIPVASSPTISPNLAPTPEQRANQTHPKHSPPASSVETGQCVAASPTTPTVLRVMACEPPALQELVGAVRDVGKQLHSLTQAVLQTRDERRATSLELGQLVEAIRGLGDLGQALKGLVEVSRTPPTPRLPEEEEEEEEEERPRRGDV
ncbi:soluble scavenger receptor cysteine-rich domain-containing protein SSC5D [Macrotis lagotis]|uniref:soluble scavenger receptor cysteine-rich domain-containing protein SSC5D n=1 Tax=Macrotis lagotis TaxID=92651 RepID=UPI003D68DF4E